MKLFDLSTPDLCPPQSNRVTLKMDVSHTEHSHVIGKGGNNIKKVMEETGCHIHFPDSNRNNQAEKSNQVGQGLKLKLALVAVPEKSNLVRLVLKSKLALVLARHLFKYVYTECMCLCVCLV